MNNLEERQGEMRGRMKKQAKAVKDEQESSHAASSNERGAVALSPSEMVKRIALLEAENAALRAENETLRRQKTVYVEGQKSAEDARREQIHNYFKYSNVKRW